MAKCLPINKRQLAIFKDYKLHIQNLPTLVYLGGKDVASKLAIVFSLLQTKSSVAPAGLDLTV